MSYTRIAGISRQSPLLRPALSLSFRPILALSGQSTSIPLGLNNRGWAPVTLFLAGAVAVALVFACTTTYARKERVTGYLTPRGGVARLAAPRPGVLTDLFVKNGDMVKEGDPLFTIDTSHGLVGGGTLDAAVADGLRQQIALLDEQIAAEQARTQSEGDRLTARIRGLTVERSSLNTQRSLQMERTAVTEARLEALSELRTKGYVSGAEYRAREEAWLSQRQSLAALEQRLTGLDTDIKQMQFERERAPIDSSDRISRLLASQAELRQRLAEVNARKRQLILAPKSGRITALQSKVGMTVDNLTSILCILSDSETLQAKIFVPDNYVAFVIPGQTVRISYDSFPDQYYGIYTGTVQSISKVSSISDEPRGISDTQTSSYIVIVDIDSQFLHSKHNKIPLFPDMKLSAYITTYSVNFLSKTFY